MTANSQLSTTEPTETKTKTNYANNQDRNRITEMEITWRVISGERVRGEWEKGTGNKKYNWQAQNKEGYVKNSIGNGEAKEIVCITHGHE